MAVTLYGSGNAVVQIVNASYSTSTSTTSTSFVTTGLSASITPKSASNKILAIVSMPTDNAGSGTYSMFLTLYRGTVSGTNLGNATTGFGAARSGGSETETLASITCLDSPATTSATIYTVGFRSQNGSNTAIVCFNSAVATLTLMEIAYA